MTPKLEEKAADDDVENQRSEAAAALSKQTEPTNQPTTTLQKP